MPDNLETIFALTPTDKADLLTVARRSIEHGLHYRRALPVEQDRFSPTLQQPAATFVTLHHRHDLRGCIGTLEADRPLVAQVAHFAYLAAFSDSRFSGVTWEEFPELEIHISILSRLEPLQFASEEDLLAQIRPGIDGLLLEAGEHRGTFLPSVWSQIPAPSDFLKALKRKAGLTPDYWDAQLNVSRYTTLSFADSNGTGPP